MTIVSKPPRSKYRRLKYTQLMEAAAAGDVEDVKSLIESGDDVNASGANSDSALRVAVKYAFDNKDAALRIVELLLDAGAAIDVQDARGETPVMLASLHNYTKILKLLIERGADVNLRRMGGYTAISMIEIMPSIVNRRKTVLKILREAGGVP